MSDPQPGKEVRERTDDGLGRVDDLVAELLEQRPNVVVGTGRRPAEVDVGHVGHAPHVGHLQEEATTLGERRVDLEPDDELLAVGQERPRRNRHALGHRVLVGIFDEAVPKHAVLAWLEGEGVRDGTAEDGKNVNDELGIRHGELRGQGHCMRPDAKYIIIK